MTRQKFEELYQEYHVRGYLFIYRIVRDKEAAMDIVQDSFVAIWEYAKYNKIEKEYSFVMQTFNNRAIGYLRKVKSRHIREADYATQEVDDSDLIWTEVMTNLYKEVNKLPPVCSRIVNLVLRGHTLRDIAGMLNITRQTANNQYSIAVKKLRSQLH